MGVFDKVNFFDEPAAPTEPGLGDLAVQGLRSGLYQAKGQVHKLAGTVMDAVGADGSTQNAKSKVANAYAQAEGRDLVPLDDVHDVRSGLRWAAGTAGQVAPMAGAMLGASLATGGGAVAPLVAGTALQTPLEIGGHLQRQEQDSANRFATPGERLATAGPVGLARAAVTNIIPAGVASRMVGGAGRASMGQIALRGAADVPAQAAAMGAAEGMSQVADNVTNPEAGYDVGAVGHAAKEGAAMGAMFGAAGAAGHAVHSSAGALKAAPGRALDVAKGLVPDSVKDRLSGAKDAAGEAADAATTYAKDGADSAAEAAAKAAEWAKKAINAKVADVKAWGQEWMADEAAPDSFKAQVQDAIRNPGDKAKQLWMATQKFTRDAAAKAQDAVEKADVPTRLRTLHKDMADKGRGLMDRMARGEEVADTAEILAAGDDADKATEVFAKADQTAAAKAKEWGEQMLNEHLGEEKTAQLKQWLANVGDKASQTGIAGLKIARDEAKRAQGAIGRFAEKAKATEAGAAAQLAAHVVKGKLGTKKSEVYAGAREKIAKAVLDVMGEGHPALDDPAVMTKLGDGLRSFLTHVENGGQLDHELMSALTDLSEAFGSPAQTKAVLEAVQNAMGASPEARAATSETLKLLDVAESGRKGVVAVMQKALKPELQDAVRGHELRAEAEMLHEWARSKNTNHDAQIRAALEHRYGDKAEVVIAAVEKTVKAEENALNKVRASSEEVIGEDPADPTGREFRAGDEATKHNYFAQNGQLYLHPEHAPTSKFDDAATQRMKTAKKENPDADVVFRRVSELDDSDPKIRAMIREKHNDLVELISNDPNWRDLGDPEDLAAKELEKYGLVVAEQSTRDTELTPGEIKLVKLDAGKYPNSPSRIDTHGPATAENTAKGGRRTDGNIAIDAVKLTEFMNARLKNDRGQMDETGPARDARMFKEGIAALVSQVGHTFDIPDSVQINRQKLTWGEAKKLDPRTAADKQYDRASAELDRQRANYKKASPIEKRNLREMAEETLMKRAERRDEELTREPGEPAELDDRAAEKARREARLRDIVEQMMELDINTRAGAAKERALWNEAQELAEANLRSGFHDVRQEVDPFGPTHDTLRGKEEGNPIHVNADGSARDDTVMGRRRPAKHDPRAKVLDPVPASKREAREMAAARAGGPPSPKALAAKKAAFLEKTRSGDPELLKTLKASDNAKGLQRALEALKNEKGENAERVIDAINRRMVELIKDPNVRYGLQTKKYSLQSEAIHAALGRPGFAATHDSPIRHEGKFDWRTHATKGEGAMVKGAGTYLSTSDVVHGYYKKAFGPDSTYRMNAVLDEALSNAREGKGSAAEIREAAMEDIRESMRDYDDSQRDLHYEALKVLRKMSDSQLTGDPSPTYHLSVDIRPEQLLDWDKPVEKQSEAVEKVMREISEKFDFLSDVLRRGEDFYRALAEHFDADRDIGDRKASDYLQSLGILGHRMKASAKDGDQNPNYVIYDDDKIHTNYVHFDKQGVAPGAAGPVNRAEVLDYLGRVHGPSIQLAWKNIMHAGEFERTATADVIRLSVHSLNPLSAAYHEALHGFMAKLRDDRHADIAAVLDKAGGSAPVMNQLRKLLANEPAALKQLSDPEERVAYMYQFWAQGKLKLGDKATTIFQRIAQFLREVTGMWTNDQRAEKIMEYFHSGEYEANRAMPSVVHRALMEAGTVRAWEKAKAMTEPLREMGEALASAGGTRLRDTGIPALRQLADAMKLKTTTEGQDSGFLPAARSERTRIMNQIGRDLKGYTSDQIDAALHQLQTGIRSADVKVRSAAATVSKHLDDALSYMQAAGVGIEHLGMAQGVPYFPRSWDASYISSHQKEFLAMIAKYPQFRGDPHKTMQKLMVTDGAEFGVEVDKPGMQHSKERVLSFISHADAAPFMRKDLYQILNSYVSQATRRAEWARRFGDDGSGVSQMLAAARAQGATDAQLEAAQNFIRSVDGTLGDTINPVARRAMGDMIVYQNIRLLPLAIFSSLVDSQGIMVRGGTVGEAFKTFKRGMKEVVKNFQKDPKSDAMTDLAEAIGTIDNAHLVHTLGASYSQGMVGDRGRAINDTFFRLNLMEQYNSSMRVGATEAALNFIARHATKPGEHSERYLRELGLTAADVQLDASGRPKVLESDGLSLMEAAKMKAAVNRWVDGAVLRPDAVDKPIWMSDPHYALVAHLKQFVYSFHETILKRVVHEAQHGNYAPGAALASYVPMMLAADMIKGVVQGGGEQPDWKDGWGPGDYLWSAMERAGLFGTGQFAIDALSDVQRGGSGVGALSGPTVEQLTDAIRVMGGREHFKPFAVKSMPANALYGSAFEASAPDPKFAE